MSTEILCNTCRMIFANAEEHKIHFKSPLHVFNLKRKVANLAPVTKEQYERKLEQISSKENKNKFEGKCKACNKSFNTKNSYEQHLNSKKHLKNEEKKVKSEKTVKTVEKENQEKEDIQEEKKEEKQVENKTLFPSVYSKILDTNVIINSNMKQEEGDEELLEEEEKKMIEEKIKSSYQFGMEECIFCFKISNSFDSNVKHMTKDHGMFLPDLEYLVDLEGIIYYLGKKLSIGHTCLWCERQFNSLESVQHHMKDKGEKKKKKISSHLKFFFMWIDL